MRAVKEQREKFWKLSSDFAQRLKSHLIDIFQRHVSSISHCVGVHSRPYSYSRYWTETTFRDKNVETFLQIGRFRTDQRNTFFVNSHPHRPMLKRALATLSRGFNTGTRGMRRDKRSVSRINYT